MQSIQQLPPGYAHQGTIDLSENVKLAVLLNVFAIALLLVFTRLMTEYIGWFHPAWSLAAALDNTLRALLAFAAVLVVMPIVHEAVHGVFFWWFTRSRPRFGATALYAYAGAPDWYIPRRPYLVVGLAPFVVITAVCLALIPVVPSGWVFPLGLLAVLNASGCVGDFAVVIWILRHSQQVLVQDTGDTMSIFEPAR